MPEGAGKHTTESAKAALRHMGGTVIFEKMLTSSDVNGTGRLVIPKSQAEAHFPKLDKQQARTMINLVDTNGNEHSFRYRFWANAQNKMFLLEHTASVLQEYGMKAGDVLVFAKLKDGSYAICGRQGTSKDVTRNTVDAVSRRVKEEPSPGEAEKQPAKRKRHRSTPGRVRQAKARHESQVIQTMYTYWSGGSLPIRRDGVFRAMPHRDAVEGNRVLAQCGAWSAIVTIEGELFQAFFDTLDAANAALQVARQGKVEEEAAAPTPSGGDTPAAAGNGGGGNGGGGGGEGGSAATSRGASLEPPAKRAASEPRESPAVVVPSPTAIEPLSAAPAAASTEVAATVSSLAKDEPQSEQQEQGQQEQQPEKQQEQKRKRSTEKGDNQPAVPPS